MMKASLFSTYHFNMLSLRILIRLILKSYYQNIIKIGIRRKEPPQNETVLSF